MASIKGIAKSIIKNFKEAENFTGGVKATVGQAKEVTRNATKKAVNATEEASENISQGVFSKENIEKLKTERDETKAVHRKNVNSNRNINKQIDDEVANFMDDPDFVDNAIDSELSPAKLIKERKKKAQAKYGPSEEEQLGQLGDRFNYYKANAKYYGAQIGSKTKAGAGWVGRNGFKVTEDAETFLGYDIELSGKAKALAWGAVGLYGGYEAYSSLSQSKMGEIEGGVSVGTINQTFSKEFDNMVTYANGSPEGLKEFGKVTMGDNFITSRLNNVNPEIVFALHELRNGGGS